MPDRAPTLPVVPLDDRARDGGYHLVFAADEFAIARFADDGRWLCATDHPLHHEPEAWHPPELYL